MNVNVIIGGSRIVLIGSLRESAETGAAPYRDQKEISEEGQVTLKPLTSGKVIALTFRLSPQKSVLEVNIRPLQEIPIRQSMDCLFFPRKLIEC